MASGRAYAHPRWNANAEGPAKKEVGDSSAMLADGTTAVRSVPRGIRHFPPATTAIQRVHDLVRPGKTSDLWTTSALGLVSRVLPVHTAVRNCTRDEGGPFEVGNQVLTSSRRKLLWSKATVVNVAEKSEQDFDRYD